MPRFFHILSILAAVSGLAAASLEHPPCASKCVREAFEHKACVGKTPQQCFCSGHDTGVIHNFNYCMSFLDAQCSEDDSVRMLAGIYKLCPNLAPATVVFSSSTLAGTQLSSFVTSKLSAPATSTSAGLTRATTITTNNSTIVVVPSTATPTPTSAPTSTTASLTFTTSVSTSLGYVNGSVVRSIISMTGYVHTTTSTGFVNGTRTTQTITGIQTSAPPTGTTTSTTVSDGKTLILNVHHKNGTQTTSTATGAAAPSGTAPPTSTSLVKPATAKPSGAVPPTTLVAVASSTFSLAGASPTSGSNVGSPLQPINQFGSNTPPTFSAKKESPKSTSGAGRLNGASAMGFVVAITISAFIL